MGSLTMRAYLPSIRLWGVTTTAAGVPHLSKGCGR